MSASICLLNFFYEFCALMKFTLQTIADNLSGEILGNTEIEISAPSKIEEGKPGTISFLANPKYEEFLYSTQSSAVIVSKSMTLSQKTEASLIVVDDAYSAFVKVLTMFQQSIFTKQGIHDSAVIEPSAHIGDGVYIGANVSIGEHAVINDGAYIMPNSVLGDSVEIGKHTIIYPNVSINHFCKVGNYCIIHSGTVIGSDGFGFAPNKEGVYSKVPQIGNVEIGNHVEIGANCAIDRATMGSTIIGNGVKLDNMVHLAHNVVIDEHTVIAAQAGISGSTKIGKHVIVGGQAGFVGHIQVADGTKINAKSGISKSITEPNLSLSGAPAFNWKDELRAKAVFKILPELKKRIEELEKLLKDKHA